MMYPTISEYIEAIRFAEDNFETLTDLRPVLDGDGNPVMSSGNFAVVFKMQDATTKKLYALKCFTREQEGRAESYRLISDELEYVSIDYMLKVKYLDKELFVDTRSSDETEFPVVLMDWVEGTTLDKWISRNIGSQYSLQLITHQFCRMASWLLSQPFAHGDLKPDNIIVTESGSIVLVDYDGMYVPAMQGQKSRELGSPDYRHPSRTLDDFNEHIDDFSLAAIAMQLAAIALDPTLYSNHDGDTLLLTEQDHRDIANSDSHYQLLSLLHNPDFERLFALYHLAHAQQTQTNVVPRAFTYPKPDKSIMTISTKVTKEDIENGVKDEYGAIYSPDGLRLLKGVNVEQYATRPGTKVICDNAFEDCPLLLSAILSDSVVYIGNSAFEWCENLKSITIPDSVTHIGNNAFAGCKNLTLTSIPDSVTHIGDNPFRGVRDIKCEMRSFEVDENALYTRGKKTIITFFKKNNSEFAIPNTVTLVANKAFSWCVCLSSILIPKSVTRIGNSAFEWCENLKSITIPDSVTHIGDGAFDGCRSLATINIPDSVTHIGDGAFDGCRSLATINIPNSVTHIGNGVFGCCENLKSITIPASVTSIGANPFETSGICHVKCDSACFEADEYALYTKDKKKIISFFNKQLTQFSIPDSVTHIGDRAFVGCNNLTSIIIPGSVTHIGNGAFSFCRSLTSITIPDSVTHIGDRAFLDCESLTSITIPDSVTHIGDGAFDGCRSLISVTIPVSVTRIGDNTFEYCENLKSITIPDSVTHIGDSAFHGCSSLTSITIPDSVTHIGDGAFHGCSSLTSITIPDSVNCISDWTYAYCSSLTTIFIPKSVTHIGDSAFGYCRSLTSITIPDTVTHIGNNAFSDCCSLTSITIPSSVTHIGNSAFGYCDSLTSIIIPDSVASIGVNPFEHSGICHVKCDSACFEADEYALYTKGKKKIISFFYKQLIQFSIPDSVTCIGNKAFYCCLHLVSITIPISVAHIGDGAFAHCRNLASAFIVNPFTTIGNNVFMDCCILPKVTVGRFDDVIFGDGDYNFT